MSAETNESQPGPRWHVYIADQPFGKKTAESINATFRVRGVETRNTYGLQLRRFSWKFGESSSPGPKVHAVHILPEDNKLVYEGDMPSYPLPPTGHSTSGSLRFDRIIAEEQSGTLSIQFTTEEHGKNVSQILDINRSGQIHMHEPSTDKANHPQQFPICVSDNQQGNDPGYTEKEIMP